MSSQTIYNNKTVLFIGRIQGKNSVFCPITFLNTNSMPGVVFVINELTIQFVRHHGRFNFICSLDIPSHISVNVSRTIFKAICIFKMSVFKGTKEKEKKRRPNKMKILF